MSIASDCVTLEIPLLFQPGQVYPVSCSDHCWKKNRVTRHVSHISEQGWPYGWLWISLRCWRSVQTGCCQSVNGAQAFQFSHGEVCVTEPRGQTHEAMPVCALLDAQPHLPHSSFPDLILRFESENRTFSPLSFSSVILGEGLLSVSLSSPV